jgi:hypothetical protein
MPRDWGLVGAIETGVHGRDADVIFLTYNTNGD